ncbi:MAG TPA: NAD-dependent epimerase/dehydratase family protein [Cyclobacteriaceae bacterium]|nr:NAD-dependent epimerase/dehydratase family protein [Cyclobacteriaceae bacterium]
MKILVTGADGLLGSNLVRELLTRGHNIRAFVQPGRQQKTLEGLNLEKFPGDLLNPEDVIKAASGYEAVIHCAASTSVWPTRSAIVNRVNIEGTKNIIQAVRLNNVQRMIYVGTANSFGFGTKENPGVEGNPYKSETYGLDYMDSKYKAQQVILNEVKENSLPAVIVNPTFMFGPYDSNPSSGAMIVALYKGKVPGYTSGGRNYLCAKDAAVAIANALTKGRIGECYILGNQNLSYQEAFQKIAATIGVKAPSIAIPPVFAKLYGRIGSLIGNITRKAPAISYPLSRIACDEHYFSPAKAVRELELPQTPIETGIKECFEWLQENNYLK